MNTKKQKEKLRIPIPIRLLVHVPLDVDEYVDPDALEEGEFGIPSVPSDMDQEALMAKAMKAYKCSPVVEECIGVLASAAQLLISKGIGVTCHVCPFVGAAKDVKIKGGEHGD